MSRHVEVPCWVDGVPFENMTLAADDLGVNVSVLSRAHKDHTRFQVLDESNRLRTVDFQNPGPVEPPPPPPLPHPRRPGEPLLRFPITHRLGAYR
jgi:hypothetical protein